MSKLRLVLDIEGVTEERVIAAGPVFRVTGQDEFDVAAEPVALGSPEEIDRAEQVTRAVAEGRGLPDDRETSGGARSNDARLLDWVRACVPDRRIRMDGKDAVTLTGGEIFDLLFSAADRFYHYGTDDVGARPARKMRGGT